MSMEMTAWHALYHTTQAPEERRPLSLATLRRIGGFARPHAALLGSFLVCSVLGSVLAVATPVVAGQAVDGIVGGAPNRRCRGMGAAHRRYHPGRGGGGAGRAVAVGADR